MQPAGHLRLAPAAGYGAPAAQDGPAAVAPGRPSSPAIQRPRRSEHGGVKPGDGQGHENSGIDHVAEEMGAHPDPEKPRRQPGCHARREQRSGEAPGHPIGRDLQEEAHGGIAGDERTVLIALIADRRGGLSSGDRNYSTWTGLARFHIPSEQRGNQPGPSTRPRNRKAQLLEPSRKKATGLRTTGTGVPSAKAASVTIPMMRRGTDGVLRNSATGWLRQMKPLACHRKV